MDRRSFLRLTSGTSTLALSALAGCATREPDPEPPDPNGDAEPDEPRDEGTLRVATTEPFFHGDEPASAWLKEEFEDQFEDAEIDWVVPNAGIEHYIERNQRGFFPGVDAYVGLSVDELALVDAELGSGGLFRSLNRDRIETLEGIRTGLELDDPDGRILPVSTQYSCVLVDETATEAPSTLDELLDPSVTEAVLMPKPQPAGRGRGRSFLGQLYTTLGDDGALEAWETLETNGIEIRENWIETLLAYAVGERPMAIAYASDALAAIDAAVEPEPDEETDDDDEESADDDVDNDDSDDGTDSAADDENDTDDSDDGNESDDENGADNDDEDDTDDDPFSDDNGTPRQYQITYLDGQSYAEPLQMAIFDEAIHVDLAYTFLEFLLTREVQAGLAPRLGQYPVRSIVELEFPEEYEIYADYADEPATILSHSYETRRTEFTEWLDTWSEQFDP
ncbi:ABC transporter substrate-binding protein [Natronosalvus vescus]|uniref:ABC transporter substrate-binding protein n=1 Tax=Natronosalvus vescus TaxID=2953881 RepID=UPI002090597C|nr:ABC transporter substrate-binding protein [Natronosalvus vescus]